MVNQKDKGNRWERDAAKILSENWPGAWKRIAMSGAIGTVMNIPMLGADILGDYDFYPYKFAGECKAGYGGKQMTIHKDWFDHVAEVAEGFYAIPLVVLKFDNARSGVRNVIAMDFKVWDKMMAEYESLKESHDRLLKKVEELEDGKNTDGAD